MADPAGNARSPARLRGQPLIFLATVLVVWTAARVVQVIQGQGEAVTFAGRADLPRPQGSSASPHDWPPAGNVADARTAAFSRKSIGVASASDGPPGARFRAVAATSGDLGLGLGLTRHSAKASVWQHDPIAAPARLAPGLPLPDARVAADRALLEDVAIASSLAPLTSRATDQRDRRWSAYGWTLIRARGGGPVLAADGQYGGSQAGALLRWRTGDGRQAPALYARITSALNSPADGTLAFGAAVRPLAGVPVELAMERRVAIDRNPRDAFAVFMSGGKGFVEARSGVQIEGYGQAGIVGLSQRRGFFDAQLLATRPVAQRDPHTVLLGGGIWAGGQQDLNATGRTSWVYRVDLGPRVALNVPLGEGNATLALDWRHRVSGDAAPGSGAAVSLTAGF